MGNKLPHICPSCNGELIVAGLQCEHCETNVTGSFDLPLLARLTQEEQNFIVSFVKSSGSLKNMEKELGLSYPTVRNLLDDLITKIKTYEH